jgi:release factor glutamine methyltransferase
VTAVTDTTWTISAVLKWASEDFRTRGIDSPRLDAEVLLGHAIGATRTQLVIEGLKPLRPDELARFRDMVKRRRLHEPIAYIVGVREFYGRPFRVDRRVLVPRPDTETLVDVALARTRHASMHALALDLCTGSGCVAITLARERRTIDVLGTDTSADAIAVAEDNALRLGAYNARFVVSDLFGNAPQHSFDLVTANPPYIPTAEVERLSPDIARFEPRTALDGGGDGLVITRRIIEQAGSHLVVGGVLALEVGAGQAQQVLEAVRSAGFDDVETARDYGRIERVVSGVWSKSR